MVFRFSSSARMAAFSASFKYGQAATSSRVRKHPSQKPVVASMLQMEIHGEGTDGASFMARLFLLAPFYLREKIIVEDAALEAAERGFRRVVREITQRDIALGVDDFLEKFAFLA